MRNMGSPPEAPPTPRALYSIRFCDARGFYERIMLAFSLLFTLEGGREILRWILKFAQAFPKEVSFRYYRILRGFKRLLQSLQDPLTVLVSRPRAP